MSQENQSSGFLSRSDTNWAVLSHKMAKISKRLIFKQKVNFMIGLVFIE